MSKSSKEDKELFDGFGTKTLAYYFLWEVEDICSKKELTTIEIADGMLKAAENYQIDLYNFGRALMKKK